RSGRTSRENQRGLSQIIGVPLEQGFPGANFGSVPEPEWRSLAADSAPSARQSSWNSRTPQPARTPARKTRSADRDTEECQTTAAASWVHAAADADTFRDRSESRGQGSTFGRFDGRE